jgi:hypothetical protein
MLSLLNDSANLLHRPVESAVTKQSIVTNLGKGSKVSEAACREWQVSDNQSLICFYSA